MKTKRVVKGICQDCAYRWAQGYKKNVEHLYCMKKNGIIKNTKMKNCPDYEQASKERLKLLKKWGFGNIGKI